MKKSLSYAIAGVFAALEVLLLAAGSVVWVFAYTVPLVCGIIMLLLRRLFGTKTALTVFFAVGILSLLLLGDKECALLYALFFGWYPLLRERFSRLPRALSFVLKLLLFNAAVIAAELLCIYVLGIPLDDFPGKWAVPVMLAAGNLIFLIYDRLLDVLLVLYEKKYKSRLEKLLK